MRERNLPVKILVLLALPLVGILAVTNESVAQDMGRTGKGEVFGIWQMMGKDTASGGGVDLNFDESHLFGFGLGYNIDENLNVNTDFLFGSADLDAGALGEELRGDTRIIAWDVNLDYNFMEGNFTPLVTGGIGFMNFDGDFGSGSASFSETDFSYNLGAGVRWEFNDNMFLKAVYRFNWVKLKDTDSAMLMDGLHVAFGITF